MPIASIDPTTGAVVPASTTTGAPTAGAMRVGRVPASTTTGVTTGVIGAGGARHVVVVGADALSAASR